MRALVLLALAVLLAGCASQPAATVPTPEPTPPPPTPTPASPTLPGVPLLPATPPPAPTPVVTTPEPSELGVLILSITDTGFEDPIFTVPLGTTVTWINEGAAMHSVVSSDGGFAGSGPIGPGSEYTRTFDRLGVYPYHDRYNLDLMGVITVA